MISSRFSGLSHAEQTELLKLLRKLDQSVVRDL
jgi:hypothetical protein